MKARLTILTLVLCSIFATSTVFGQSVFIWDGGGDGTNLTTAANWNPDGVPSFNAGGVGDEVQWDGTVPGALRLSVVNNFAWQGFSGGAFGYHFHMTGTQTGSLNIYSPVPTGSQAGIRFADVTIDTGAGPFLFGDDTTTTIVDIIEGGVNGQIHNFINNSVNDAVIFPNVKWRNGGGGAHTYVFDGTGNWVVSNYIAIANPPGSIAVTKQGTGTMTWTGVNTAGSAGTGTIGNPTTINDGTLILKSPDLLATQNINHNGVLLKYDAASGECILSGAINGIGALEVSNGKLTLSGNNAFTGNITLSGGTLAANSTENVGVSGPLGVGGIISFSGGTLAYGPNNAFDYSSRFSAAASQAYSFDTAGQSSTFATGLSSAGGSLAKTGAGTLTLAGTSSYTGSTIVNQGRLVFVGSKTGTGNITVSDGAALGVTATGTQVTPATLTLGTTTDTTLEFNNVNSTTTAPLAATTLSSAGTVTINVNNSTFNTIGLSYPLLSWTGGSAPAVTLGTLSGASGNLTTNGNTIQLNITATPYIWTGLNDNSWDLSTPNNWVQSGVSKTFVDGVLALLDDSATGPLSINVNALVQPASTTINSVTNAYTITSSGGNNIGGTNSLTKSGSSTLVLAGGANTYTGVTTIGGGIVNVTALANGGSPSDIGQASSSAGNLVLNGGTLQYTGSGASINRLFSVGTSGGSIEASSGVGALNLNGTGNIGLVGSGPRSLTLTGTDVNDNTVAANIINSPGGATSLTKSGLGKWVLTGTNTYSGVTTIANGWLQIGAGGPSGTLGSGNVVNSTSLSFNRTDTTTVPGIISGIGGLTNDGSGTVILANNNTYSGGTVINAGTLQIGNGGSSGKLALNSPIVDEGTLIFNSTGTFELDSPISGAGNVIVRGNNGKFMAIGANTYTGTTVIDPGATFQPSYGNVGALASSAVTNNGTLLLMRQDNLVFIYPGPIVGTGRVWKENNNFNTGDVTLTGSNTYSGNTLITGGGIIVGDGANNGSIIGNVTFNNSTVIDTPDRFFAINRSDDVVFPGNIIGATVPTAPPQGNLGQLRHNGAGRLTITGNNTYAGGTVIALGVLEVGNGGGTGSIGNGDVTDNGTIIFNRSGNLTVNGAITGGGSVVKSGSGLVVLNNTNLSYSSSTTVSNGTLTVFGSALNGTTNTLFNILNVEGGTLIAGGIGSAIMVAVGGDMNIDSGTVVASLNTALSPSFSNTTYSVLGGLNANPGTTLKVLNAGPLPTAPSTFPIFDKAVTGGGSMTIVSPGMTVVNNLGVDGSITVTAVQPAPSITASVSGGSVNLSWPAAWTGGVHLQAQTNSVTKGVSSNWVTIAGSDLSNTYSAPLNTSNVCVFYRLVMP